MSVYGNVSALPGSHADALSCRTPSLWGKTPSPHGFKEWKYTGPGASGSAYLMEFGSDLKGI